MCSPLEATWGSTVTDLTSKQQKQTFRETLPLSLLGHLSFPFNPELQEVTVSGLISYLGKDMKYLSLM